MKKKDILTIMGSGLAAGLFAKSAETLMKKSYNKHDSKLHPGEIAPGIFQVAGEQINFIERTHDGKAMSDAEYESWKDILKPHID